jgi:hypothetical protein
MKRRLLSSGAAGKATRSSICCINMSEQAASFYIVCQSIFTATRSASQFQGMTKPEFRSYRMIWKICLQLQDISQPDCSTSKDVCSMLQGGSVFRYQPVDQQITARTVAAPATHRSIDLFWVCWAWIFLHREKNSQIRLQVDVTKSDGKGKLPKATRIIQHRGSKKRSSV